MRPPHGRIIVLASVLAGAVVISMEIGASALARGTGRRSAPSAHTAAAAPCASQGSCKYCGSGGVGTGNCTTARLEYNVAWCGRHKHRLGAGNKAKCAAEARYLSWGPADRLLPWINIVCAPPNARTIYLVVKGIVERTGPVGVACAGISLYAGLDSLLVKII